MARLHEENFAKYLQGSLQLALDFQFLDEGAARIFVKLNQVVGQALLHKRLNRKFFEFQVDLFAWLYMLKSIL